MTARPRHYAKDEQVITGFKNFAGRLAQIQRGLGLDTPIEIWIQDEMHVDQKNKFTVKNAELVASAYLFGVR